MHKIAFLTDIHANLPALEAVLNNIRKLKIDETIIGGDSIGIGPYPAETLQILMNLSNSTFINGNHELVAIYGISKLVEQFGTDHGGYLEHADWCNSQLSPKMIEYLKNQHLTVVKNVEDLKCNFMHYAIDHGRSKSIHPFKQETIQDAEIKLSFSEYSGSIVGFGHLHNACNKKIDSTTYLNPGSLGCYDESIARFAVIEIERGKFEIKMYAVRYEDEDLYKKFEEREVPDRQFIYKAFFGGRFTIK